MGGKKLVQRSTVYLEPLTFCSMLSKKKLQYVWQLDSIISRTLIPAFERFLLYSVEQIVLTVTHTNTLLIFLLSDPQCGSVWTEVILN